MTLPTLEQKKAHEIFYTSDAHERFNYHFTKDPLTRFLRDRRLNISLKILEKSFGNDLRKFKILSVCGGVGGEGAFFLRNGFGNITVSDISINALNIAKKIETRLITLNLDAESMDIPDSSFDIVIVHDGLHHLTRPALGLTEMLRVAKRAAIIIEPYNGIVGNWFGSEWEKTEDATNYVYRWDKKMIEQTVKSFLLRDFKKIYVNRIWDHNYLIYKITILFPKIIRLSVAKMIYTVLTPFNFLGNNMIAVILK